MGLPWWLSGKESTCNAGDTRDMGSLVQSLGREDHQEKGMATHTSILAWRIPWTEEPGKLQPMGLQRVRHDRRVMLVHNYKDEALDYYIL